MEINSYTGTENTVSKVDDSHIEFYSEPCAVDFLLEVKPEDLERAITVAERPFLKWVRCAEGDLEQSDEEYDYYSCACFFDVVEDALKKNNITYINVRDAMQEDGL